MPLVAFSDLPTFQRLWREHHDVLSLDQALHQDIRELHVGLLNMMPDAALQATERQFMRLVGDCNQIVQIYVHLFTIPAIPRSPESQRWIAQYYEDFDTIKRNGLDALIISGANPSCRCLSEEAFWPMLTEVVDWALENVTSTLCACLASHAILKYRYNIDRQPLEEKQWGVFEHRVNKIAHPLTRHINSRFDVPHSRFNQVSECQLASRDIMTLVKSEDAGVHLAVSPDGIRLVFFQGHPEYDHCSLLKEYKREIDSWFGGQRSDYPRLPVNYFNGEVSRRLLDYRRHIESAKAQGKVVPEWPEAWIEERLDNTWRDTALTTFNNWLGVVYRLTSQDRNLPFMQGIDPLNPLQLLFRNQAHKMP
jgi:homoserine O-succinyltransferase/O-acetyltransferase